MEQIKQKDKTSFEELVRRYTRPLCAYLRRIIQNEADADDVLQETFLSVWMKADLFTTGKKVRPWLYSLAHHKSIDLRRRLSRRKEYPPLEHVDEKGDVRSSIDLITDPSSIRVPDFPDHLMERVQLAVSQLAPQISPAIEMAYWQQLKYREIAEVLDIPIGTVKSRLNAGLQNLKVAVQMAP